METIIDKDTCRREYSNRARLWTWQWTPAAPGKYTLMVRATNGKGELQEEKKQGTVPGGSKGYDMVPVEAI